MEGDGQNPFIRRVQSMPRSPPHQSIGLVTVWDGSEGHECALPLWCQQAWKLAQKISSWSWRAQLLVLAPRFSDECPGATYVWRNDTLEASQLYLDRNRITGS